MGESIEDLIETIRKKADLHLVAYQTEGSDLYRATAYFWPGTGAQEERRVTGSNLHDVLSSLAAEVDKAKTEAA